MKHHPANKLGRRCVRREVYELFSPDSHDIHTLLTRLSSKVYPQKTWKVYHQEWCKLAWDITKLAWYFTKEATFNPSLPNDLNRAERFVAKHLVHSAVEILRHQLAAAK